MNKINSLNVFLGALTAGIAGVMPAHAHSRPAATPRAIITRLHAEIVRARARREKIIKQANIRIQ